jgi:alanyl-tRNA synthetase
LSVLPGELPAAVERALADSKDLRKQVKALQEQLAVHEASSLVADAPTIGGVRVIVASLDGWDALGLKAIAAAAVARDRVCTVLLSRVVPVAVVVARSADIRVDAAALLRELTGRFGGRGGGKADLAQGGGLAGTPEEIGAAARASIDAALGAGARPDDISAPRG